MKDFLIRRRCRQNVAQADNIVSHRFNGDGRIIMHTDSSSFDDGVATANSRNACDVSISG